MAKKLVVWALFDSGNGCYKQVADELENVEIYSVGLDIKNKNTHFINLNLASYDYAKKENEIFKTLDKLPKADLIIASPPCESWSVASSMKNGNACWKQEKVDTGLIKSDIQLSKFTIRDYIDYENYQFYPERQFIRRINGELCTFNMIEIIKRYQPRYYIIENPATSKMWEYIDKILGFKIEYENPTRYGNYDDYPIAKPTKFKSNIDLKLNNENVNSKVKWKLWTKDYNTRSNIPLSLIRDIFNVVLEDFKEEENE